MKSIHHTNYLQDENAALKAQIALSINAADDVEMASRRPYLVISNIPENTSKSDEDQFIELCNNKLHLDETITKGTHRRCHQDEDQQT